jgi:hypothetical protein
MKNNQQRRPRGSAPHPGQFYAEKIPLRGLEMFSSREQRSTMGLGEPNRLPGFSSDRTSLAHGYDVNKGFAIREYSQPVHVFELAGGPTVGAGNYVAISLFTVGPRPYLAGGKYFEQD